MGGAVLVTGGTGTLGRIVVRRAAAEGGEVRLLSRRAAPAAAPQGVRWCTADLVSGEGLDAAMEGVSVVVHCASDPRRPASDLTAVRQLIEAARRVGGVHLVYISIVGVDRLPFGYYRVKRQVEELIEGSGLPWTVLRTTQFHDLPAQVFRALAKLPLVMPVPSGISVQPLAAEEVADRLVALAGGEPAGRVADMGGPRVIPGAEMARGYLRAVGKRRLLLPVPVFGASARGFRQGLHLSPERAVGSGTWEQYLAALKP
ncbi:SDR family oxidoreductase [Streptacidiphilus griseoplanus]|uniref:SDR family oxidoreductase n=1 Tax=Peterkaempfera griseoplana TaxID=66896 RepID=UPI0006E3F5FE|nr:NAD(P)H-binding protein [Peterkaempfera griseoplana]